MSEMNMKVNNLRDPRPTIFTKQYVDNILNIETLDEVLKLIEQNDIKEVKFLLKNLKKHLLDDQEYLKARHIEAIRHNEGIWKLMGK